MPLDSAARADMAATGTADLGVRFMCNQLVLEDGSR